MQVTTKKEETPALTGRPDGRSYQRAAPGQRPARPASRHTRTTPRWTRLVPAALSDRDLWSLLAELGACIRLDRPDDMFPDPGDEPAVERAVAVCRPCRVRAYCGERARRTGAAYGVWAGRLLDSEPDSLAGNRQHEEEEVTPA